MTILPILLKYLICPQTEGELIYDEEKKELISQKAGLAYPIKKNIPLMLPSEARTLEPEISVKKENIERLKK